MRRAVLATNSTWNIENFRLPLIRGLIREGYKVVTVSPDAHGIEVDGTKLKHRMCRMHTSTINPLSDLVFASRLFTVLAEERPDIYLSFTIKPNIYGSGVCRLLNIPAIPNVTGLGTAFLGSSVLRRAVSNLYRFGFGRAARVFFQNKDDRNLFLDQKLIDPERSRILPGSGVDIRYFAPAELPSGLSFLMVSRLLSNKGVREYVEAARLVRARFPHLSFSLLGELDHTHPTSIRASEVDQWVRDGIIRYLGSSADVRPFLREATAIVLPSYREGLPRTLLEGAAMGRPLIGTDVPGCREVVRDGLTGFLCRPRDANSLARAIQRLAEVSNEERMEMGARARAMAEEEFDEKFVVDAYLEAIREVSPTRRTLA